MTDLFWLSDEQWAVLEPFMPKNQPGARRVDDRRIISGIIHMLKGWTLARLSRRLWPPHDGLQPLRQVVPPRLLARHVAALAEAGWMAESTALGSTYVKVHRSAHGGKGGRAQAIGASRGDQTTKVHVLAGVLGRPAVVHLTAGNVSDVKTVPEVLAAAPGRLKRLIADKGYDADPLRRDLKAADNSGPC